MLILPFAKQTSHIRIIDIPWHSYIKVENFKKKYFLGFFATADVRSFLSVESTLLKATSFYERIFFDFINFYFYIEIKMIYLFYLIKYLIKSPT